jgi:hypothetical protein
MASLKKQRTCVKFVIKLGKIAVETHRLFCETYSNEALSKTITYKWHTFFKNRTLSTDTDKRLGKS